MQLYEIVHAGFVFQAILARYVQVLVKSGHSMEFFIEGGRSRDGKVLVSVLVFVMQLNTQVLQLNNCSCAFQMY